MNLAYCSFLLPICFTLSLSAQQVTGVLRGVVTDQSGGAIPGAVVTAISSSGPRSVTADSDGGYVLLGLPFGSWTAQVTAPGFALAEPVTVSIGTGNNTLNFQMHVAIERQEITVTDTAAPEVTMDPSQSASAQVVRSSDLEALADDPDDLVADLAALAGPSAGPNGGQIFIDGFTAGDGTLPSKDAIREIRINQNPFSPEFDTVGTGHIEILTKPGSDHLHGEAFFTYGDGLFNARNPYAGEKAPFALRDFGGSVGGRLNAKGSYYISFDRRAI